MVAPAFTDRNIKQNNRGLKNGHPNQFLDQVIFGDHTMQTNKQKDYINNII